MFERLLIMSIEPFLQAVPVVLYQWFSNFLYSRYSSKNAGSQLSLVFCKELRLQWVRLFLTPWTPMWNLWVYFVKHGCTPNSASAVWHLWMDHSTLVNNHCSTRATYATALRAGCDLEQAYVLTAVFSDARIMPDISSYLQTFKSLRKIYLSYAIFSKHHSLN